MSDGGAWSTHLTNQVYAEVSRAVNNGVPVAVAVAAVERAVTAHRECGYCHPRGA